MAHDHRPPAKPRKGGLEHGRDIRRLLEGTVARKPLIGVEPGAVGVLAEAEPESFDDERLSGGDAAAEDRTEIVPRIAQP